MKILYLEDNQQEAALVSRYLRTTPHEFRIVANLDEARNAVGEAPELIFVDLVIGPTRDGYTFIQELRAEGRQQRIVVITGLNTPRELEKCRQMGVDDILVKPFTMEKLAQLIEQ